MRLPQITPEQVAQGKEIVELADKVFSALSTKQNVIHELVDECAVTPRYRMNADFFRGVLSKWGIALDENNGVVQE